MFLDQVSEGYQFNGRDQRPGPLGRYRNCRQALSEFDGFLSPVGSDLLCLWTERDGGRERERGRERGRKKERHGVWLVGFLTSSSTTRLYRVWAPRQSV